MGFGSYDESEQGNHEIETDLDDEAVTTGAAHRGEFAFDNGASNAELIERLEEIKEGE
ncbi:DUF5786 family protein [Natronorarus salvus]|uniref:DUF5786 family protein n=1 Tax=Natronorarus salvus TaxID=3117733 RepID=UPI002F2664CD